jgi:hypothetical protein
MADKEKFIQQINDGYSFKGEVFEKVKVDGHIDEILKEL